MEIWEHFTRSLKGQMLNFFWAFSWVICPDIWGNLFGHFPVFLWKFGWKKCEFARKSSGIFWGIF